jgi:hypothetical protein
LHITIWRYAYIFTIWRYAYICGIYIVFNNYCYIFYYTSVDTEMCCPKDKCGCKYFILLTLKKKITCGWSVDFSGYSSLLHQLTDIHDTTELWPKVALSTTTPYKHAYVHTMLIYLIALPEVLYFHKKPMRIY